MDATHVLIRKGARHSTRDLDPCAPRYLDSYEAIRAALAESDREQLCLALHKELLATLCRALAERQTTSRRPTLWLRFRTGPEQMAALASGFDRVLPNP